MTKQQHTKTKTSHVIARSALSLFNGDFWFGKDNTYINVADRKVLPLKIETELFQKQNSKKEARKENSKFDLKLFQYLESPNGYIPIHFEDIDVNELFIKHGITVKNIFIDNIYFAKSVVLSYDNREIDCFNTGENRYALIEKESENKVTLSVYDKYGNIDSVEIVNGKVISGL